MKDLKERVAELFSPKPWKHDMRRTEDERYSICYRCKVLYPDSKGHCPIPTPIDITDLGKALKCLRSLLKGPWGITRNAMMTVYAKCIDNTSEDTSMSKSYEWTMENAIAEQIWEINCLAKEEDKT